MESSSAADCHDDLDFKWLKKYTRLEYVKDILTSKTRHLGEPSKWDDRNDSELMHRWSELHGYNSVRATCLTYAPDRFHFWDVFGGREKGVCLWFCPEGLIEDAQKAGLNYKRVAYRSRNFRNLEKVDLAFLKRRQYASEREYRIIRASPNQQCSDKFPFSSNSLRRIYLNSWLPCNQVDDYKKMVSGWLGSDLKHVSVFQNRVLKSQDWLNKTKEIQQTKS